MDYELASRRNESNANSATHERMRETVWQMRQIVCADSVADKDLSNHRVDAQCGWEGGQEVNGFGTNGRAKAVVAIGGLQKPAVMISPNREDSPGLQDTAAPCGLVTWTINVTNTDYRLSSGGIQGISSSF